MLQDEILSNEIIKEYREHIHERTLLYGKIGGWMALIFPVYFLIQDFYIIHYPVNTLPLRLAPIIIGVLLLILTMTRLKRHRRALSICYYLFLLSLMTMMCGLAAVYIKNQFFTAMVTGVVVIIFVIYFGSMGGYRYLLPVYALPFICALAYIIFFKQPAKHDFIVLSNPFAMIIISCVLGEVQERLRYGRFQAVLVTEATNRKLIEKNSIIEKNNIMIQEQMKLARAIQHNLIPKAIPHMKNLRIHAIYMPMFDIGGDLYDFIHFKEPNLIGIFVADVTGHGVPAALITSMVKTIANMSGREKLSPADFLKFLNDKIIDMGNLEFISAFYAIYDSDTGMMRYARAGHCPPYLIRGREITEMNARGALLGFAREQVYEEKEVALHSKDKIIFFTDGLIEAENAQRVQFYGTMRELIKNYEGVPIDKTVTELYDRLRAFVGDTSFEDDVCIVGIEVE